MFSQDKGLDKQKNIFSVPPQEDYQISPWKQMLIDNLHKIEFDMDIAKAGWLYRQSTVLHRWKKHWFVLYNNGHLKYYDSLESLQEDDKIVVYAVCLSIKIGTGCNFSPPEGSNKESLLCLMLRDGELRLCAESPDDMKAWQIALEEARVLHHGSTSPMAHQGVVYSPPGTQVMYTSTISTGYPGYVMSPPGTYVVPNAASPGSAVVVGNSQGQVVHVQRHGYRPCYRGGLFYGPMLWW